MLMNKCSLEDADILQADLVLDRVFPSMFRSISIPMEVSQISIVVVVISMSRALFYFNRPVKDSLTTYFNPYTAA